MSRANKNRLLIRGGRLIDPANQVDKPCDVWVENNLIVEVTAISKADDHIPDDRIPDDVRLVDATGCWVLPGLIDLHTHLREPGQTHKETIATGTRAAAAGGFTRICAMPNTTPYVDSVEVIRKIKEIAARDAVVRVLPVAGLTVGQKGETLTPMAELVKAGAVAFSEDGKSVVDAGLMAEALTVAAGLQVPVFSHCEDLSLVNGGVVHEGAVSRRLGLPGISSESETAFVERDIKLAAKAGAKLHICHVSAAESVAAVARAGQNVTAEVCPHHFAFCDGDISSDDGRYKMNPPLRAQSDRAALLEGLQTGVLSIIATDHAPHHADEKSRGLRASSFGVVGFETAVGAGITYLVNGGYLTPMEWVAAMTVNPARVLGIDSGNLSPGAEADITIINPAVRYVVNPSDFFSKGRSTPFEGLALSGKVVYTILGGKIIFGDDDA